MTDANPYQAAEASLDVEPTGGVAGDVPDEIVDALGKARVWIFIMAGLGLFGAMICVLAGVGMAIAPVFTGQLADSPMPLWLFGLVYLGMAVLMGLPSGLLIRFGLSIGKVKPSNGMGPLQVTLRHHSQFWMGTVATMVLGFGIYVIMMVALVAVMAKDGLPN